MLSHLTVFYRLCFGIYLSHNLIIISFIYQRRRVWMVENPLEVIIFALGITVISLLCAALLAIFVELPPLTLERKLFMRIRKNVAIRRNDEGNLTVSECGKSMQNFKRKIDSGSRYVFYHFLIDRKINTVTVYQHEMDWMMKMIQCKHYQKFYQHKKQKIKLKIG